MEEKPVLKRPKQPATGAVFLGLFNNPFGCGLAEEGRGAGAGDLGPMIADPLYPKCIFLLGIHRKET